MQRSEMGKSSSESQDATNFAITPQQFQNCLDENKNLIEAIMENRKHGKFLEAAQYMSQLQNNLIYLTKSADINDSMGSMGGVGIGIGGEETAYLRELGRMISSDNNNRINNNPPPPQQQNHFRFEAPQNANVNAMPMGGKNFKHHQTNN